MNSTSTTQHDGESDPILFPVTFRAGDQVVVCRKAMFMKYWGVRHERGNVFTYLEPVRGKEHNRIRWLMGRDGLLRDFAEIEVYRRWAKPLTWLIRACRIRVHVTQGRHVAAGEMLPLFERGKGHANGFRKFLKKLDAGHVLTSLDYLTLIHEPADEPAESLP